MTPEITQMDYDAVENMARGFENMANVLQSVSQVLQAVMTLLDLTAFTGMVGGAALRLYTERLKGRIDFLANYCTEMSRDVNNAVRYLRDADDSAAGRFSFR